MYRRNLSRVLASLVVLVAAGCGRDGGPAGGGDQSRGRTIQIEMVDTAFRPAQVTVAKGEAVAFRFTNTGKVAHEAFIGDAQAQADHEAEMGSPMPHGGGHDRGAPGALKLQPGSSGDLTYVFEEAGQIEIGCHEPGHYRAGMKVAVTAT